VGEAYQSNRKRKANKRRYDVALSTEGAEIRLPSLPSLALGWRLLSAILVAALGFAVYTILYSPMFQINEIETEGLRRLTIQDINAVVDVLGSSILYVDPSEMQEELLRAFPDLQSLSVQVGVPAKLTLNAIERQAVLAWEDDGKLLWIDANGVVFPPRGDSGPLGKVIASSLPTVANPAEETLADETSAAPPEDLGGTEAAVQMVPVDLVVAILAMVEQAPPNTPIVYDEQHGLGWQDNLGWTVFFGKDTGDMSMKLQVYKVLAKRLKKQDPRPTLVSVEYLHAPYYRVEQ
jgi:hypothetical protein